MRKKKSTQQLVGIERVTDSSVLTACGELTFYLVQPTNLNVLPESGVRTRVTALLNALKTSAEMELLALDSKESYQDNRLYYRRRAEEEGNPATRTSPTRSWIPLRSCCPRCIKNGVSQRKQTSAGLCRRTTPFSLTCMRSSIMNW